MIDNNNTIDNLEKLEEGVVKTLEYLAAQGFIVNRDKVLKLTTISMYKAVLNNSDKIEGFDIAKFNNKVRLLWPMKKWLFFLFLKNGKIHI